MFNNLKLMVLKAFVSVCQSLNIKEEVIRKWETTIQQLYAESGRYYHTINHVESLLESYKTNILRIKNHVAVLLAIYFHDLVYNPLSRSNEEDSIIVFQNFAEEVELSEALISLVSIMIRSTIKHFPLIVDLDVSLFLDFDLLILAAKKSQYDLYSKQIRLEYSHYSQKDYLKGRTEILEIFLQRERIYFCLNEYENKARSNIMNEIKMLKASFINEAS
eukprot:NODE_123_length_17687_cov_0.732261.p10 type:complete len:219 gc:universal NODE_123_length_17687_cov_0.732261:14834-14178(-)